MYHSSSGNTKKVAEAIAAAANVAAVAIAQGEKLSESIDLLFIGDGVYAGKMNKATKAFIDSLDGSMVKHAAVFGTYGGRDDAIVAMVAGLKARGVHVCAEPFGCKGQSWFIGNRNHPNKEDLDSAAKFTRDVLKSIKDQ